MEKRLKFCELEKSLYICTLERGIGLMAEWLGTALQKLLQRFESASDLQERYRFRWRFFVGVWGGVSLRLAVV